MPELPEVETTVQGIRSFIEKQLIKEIIVRHPKLRWPIPKDIQANLKNATVFSVTRRGKYILINTNKGTVLLHLGMSGSLRIVNSAIPPEKHDHIDMIFSNGVILRLRDPRRFGAFLWTPQPIAEHKLISPLGLEPLSKEFNGNYLTDLAKSRKCAIKLFIMDSKVVVGIGNIYATESLFAAGIDPKKPAGKVSQKKLNQLAIEIKKILKKAINKGGTTLKDFVDSKGKPGYFTFHLKVYGRAGQSCETCTTKLKSIVLGQRTTVYCSVCQK